MTESSNSGGAVKSCLFRFFDSFAHLLDPIFGMRIQPLLYQISSDRLDRTGCSHHSFQGRHQVWYWAYTPHWLLLVRKSNYDDT